MGTYPQAREIVDRFGLLKAYESLQTCKVTVCAKPQRFLLLPVDYSTHLTIPMDRVCVVLHVKNFSCTFKAY